MSCYTLTVLVFAFVVACTLTISHTFSVGPPPPAEPPRLVCSQLQCPDGGAALALANGRCRCL